MPVTIKGQVTIPKPIRDRLGLVPGNRVEFEALPDGRIAISKALDPEDAYAQRIARARGMAKGLDGLSTDEVMRLLRGDDDAA
ncbi:type II toxin-antitoxin system PrlF family antitoxin [Sediminicoccus sp. KRV36]|uniref:AbrB/MazE/SpoVT family DNA-binding domain-containing protein n=1 Tax=Sediminicoccus sp. KRV36 TaxID=3133721 RepID=UPI00200EBA59|nr:type II toxin-antitoxin system PrlF family antitoxin [Sediminicoccus rosea]UPY35191.1 type II toxin-antitoxin system PrlF family antitoxin [Sediminicoccus rosea]